MDSDEELLPDTEAEPDAYAIQPASDSTADFTAALTAAQQAEMANLPDENAQRAFQAGGFPAKSYTRQVFDKDGTGRMSINKLVEVMSMSGNSFTDAELEDILLNSGVDGGTVDYRAVVQKHFFGDGSLAALGDWPALQGAKPQEPLQEIWPRCHDAASLCEVAKMKAERGKIQEALELYQDALARLEKTEQAAAARSLLASTLHDMARLQENNGESEQALALYLRALKIREEVLGPDHFYVATTLDCIANLKDGAGQIEEALQFACRSLEIWERFFGREHSHIAKILYNLAGRRDLVGDTKGALEFYIRSLAIFKRVHGMRSGEVADALDGIADLKWRLGESKQALICYRRELGIREKLLGPEHSEVLELREFIASLDPS
eukprot:s2035_g15.t1